MGYSKWKATPDRKYAWDSASAIGQLWKALVNARIKDLCRREVTTKRFCHDDTSLRGTPRPRELGHDGAERSRRDGVSRESPAAW
jgi:hypothetical protein